MKIGHWALGIGQNSSEFRVKKGDSLLNTQHSALSTPKGHGAHKEIQDLLIY